MCSWQHHSFFVPKKNPLYRTIPDALASNYDNSKNAALSSSSAYGCDRNLNFGEGFGRTLKPIAILGNDVFSDADSIMTVDEPAPHQVFVEDLCSIATGQIAEGVTFHL